MSFVEKPQDHILSERLTKAIQAELRKEIRRIYEEEAKKTAEIDDLRKKIREVTELNETLMRSLKLKKNPDASIDEEIKKIADRTLAHIDWVMGHEPSKGWHVGERWGRSLQNLLSIHDIKEYVTISSQEQISGVIYKLLERIDRYEREVEKYDENLNRWAKQIMVGAPEVAWAGYEELYSCPKGGRCSLPFVDKLLEKSEFNISKASKPQEKYPKVKV